MAKKDYSKGSTIDEIRERAADRASSKQPSLIELEAIAKKHGWGSHHITSAKAPDQKQGDNHHVTNAKATGGGGGSGGGNPYHDPKTGEFTSKP